MADSNTRTVAEKLAAAKKKHKQYLKEKALKNGTTKSKNQEIENTTPEFDTITKSDEIQNQNNVEHHENYTDNFANEEKQEVSDNNECEPELPLPQYSMDNNYQSSSLPDPLSFFDNFNYTNVGSTFQNFAQPLTSFFNNTGKNESEEVMELPNQILVEENSTSNKNFAADNNTQSFQNTMNDSAQQQFFSYDRFKINALNDPVSENKEDSNELKDTFEINPVFEQFTNSVETSKEHQNLGPFLQNTENFVVPPIFNQNNDDSLISQDLQNPGNASQNSENFVVPPILEQSNKLLIADVIPSASEIVEEQKLFTFENDPNLNIASSEFKSVGLDSINTSVTAPRSSSPSIQNLSKELKDYIDEEQSFIGYSSFPQYGGTTNEPDKELTTLVENLNAKCAELSKKLYNSEMKYSNLEVDYRNLAMNNQIEADLKSRNDETVDVINKLKEDLQCHLQTIGMLVAEKTELTTLLQETQTAFRNESSQCIDLQNEIKEMKIYYTELEHELQSLKSEKTNLNSTQKQQTDMFYKLQKELKETKLQCEGHNQDLLENREKLKALTESNLSLQHQVQELNGQLSMANIKIQQLTLQDSSNMESRLQKLSEEKEVYEKQISVLNDNLKTLSKEREECSLQYQQYAEQLNDQITSLVQQLEQQQRGYDQLKMQEENRIKHIGDLEKQLQNVQNDNTSYNLQRNNSFLKKELETSSELAQNLQTEKEQLNVDLTRVLSEKEVLEKELEGYKFSVSQLESTVEQLRGSQPDNAVLLATMESDKVAASRAISQNNELKKQMDGMQEVMLKVNNDNVQLTEIVSMERKTNKDLLEKLQKTEISFQTLAEAIEIKDKELIHLRDYIENLNKQIVHQEQLTDRLRHYEAQTHSSPSLQVELQEAKQMIAHLTNELNIMKRNQLNQTSQMSQTVPVGQMNRMNQTVRIEGVNQSSQSEQIDPVGQMNQNTIEGVNQSSRNEQIDVQKSNHNVESDGQKEVANNDVIDELRSQLSNLQIRNKELESMLQNVQTDQKKVDANGNDYLDKNTAMMHLEKKFLRTMEEIARLTEEKQRLEHLVLQLQGETETIGEYVTLYQQQRSILKQRALEKDQQLQQLTNDRESIKANLDRLNNLVKKLIVEKGAIPKELLDQHEHFGKDRTDLCTEHQKIHQEINKITSNGINTSEVVNDANTEIAEEIISLLSEIKSSNLVQPNEDNIHHCAWCSGKLITV